MANTTLIRVVQGNNMVREIRFSALMGQFFDRLEKAKGKIFITDPELETKLSKEELTQLYTKFPKLNPNRPLPPKPSEEPIEFRSLAGKEFKNPDEVYGKRKDSIGVLEVEETEKPAPKKRGRKSKTTEE